MDQLRPAVVDRRETFAQPVPNRVAMNTEEFRDLGDIVTNSGLDPVERVSAALDASVAGPAHRPRHALRCAVMRSEIQRSTSSSIHETQRVEIETGAGKRPSRMYE